jgi:hypothetical protein
MKPEERICGECTKREKREIKKAIHFFPAGEWKKRLDCERVCSQCLRDRGKKRKRSAVSGREVWARSMGALHPHVAPLQRG